MPPEIAVTRRHLLLLGGAAAGALMLPETVSAATGLVDPYIGAIPFVFPLADGAYTTPLQNNWHGLREGQVYAWNHRGSTALRAHDGVDAYPADTENLPTVYAPLQGIVAAVCSRSDNTLDAKVSYRASAVAPPPWDYHTAIDDVAQLPLYGNFVWLRSSDPASAGYYVFFCHLQNEAMLQALAPDQAVSVNTALGRMGDTGNATGSPQLHVEIHYPSGNTFACGECAPEKKLTAINPYASLLQAMARPAGAAAPTNAAITAGQPASGTLAGRTGGAFANYTLANPGNGGRTVTLSYAPFDAGQAHAVGLTVYQNGTNLGTGHGEATGLGDSVNSQVVRLNVTPAHTNEPLLFQVFNYGSAVVAYTLSVA
jgi:hypothetical protein